MRTVKIELEVTEDFLKMADKVAKNEFIDSKTLILSIVTKKLKKKFLKSLTKKQRVNYYYYLK